MSNWIKCSDRLPDSDGTYLCWDGKYVDIYQLIFGNWTANHFGSLRITHWQALPEPPKEGE